MILIRKSLIRQLAIKQKDYSHSLEIARGPEQVSIVLKTQNSKGLHSKCLQLIHVKRIIIKSYVNVNKFRNRSNILSGQIYLLA